MRNTGEHVKRTKKVQLRVGVNFGLKEGQELAQQIRGRKEEK